MWSQQNRGDFTPKTHGLVRISHKEKVLCEFRTRGRCCANFAQGEGVVRISHKLKVLCEFRTSLEQLSFEGHIFLISAPNHTRFEELDSWLPKLWNGIYHVEDGLQELLQKCEGRLQLLSLFSSFCLFFLFASLLYLACLNDPKSCQNTKTSHKYD